MLKIPEAVEDILKSSEVALTAFYEDYLNLSSYALSIKRDVEEKTKKSAKIGTIVVALSRLRKTLKKRGQFLPYVKVNDLSIKTGLVEIVFNKTQENLLKISNLYNKKSLAKDYIMISHGAGEISIFTLLNAEKYVLEVFKDKPKVIIENLSSITIRLDKDYTMTANVIYGFLREFAVRNISIVELISTYTEISFIVHEKNRDDAIAVLTKVMNQ